MREVISARLAALVKDGEELLDDVREQADEDWVDDSDVTDHEMWLASVGTLLHAIGGSRSPFFLRFREIVAAQTNPSGVKVFVIRRVYALLLSTLEEWAQGTLQRVEDLFTAAAFDDLLDEADKFLESDRRVESCVLSVTVLEHAVRRIAAKQGVRPATAGFDGRIAALDAAGDTDPAKRELLSACDGLRRRIGETGWGNAEAGDIEAITRCTRRLIEQFL